MSPGPSFIPGGLIAIERGSPVMTPVIRNAQQDGGTLVVPVPVLAQVWRGGARQDLLARSLRVHHVDVDVLSRASWQAAGVLCGRTDTSDVVDAAVVVCAHERAARVAVTSDPGDLRRLDADLAYWTP